jgi:hypothetical protein
MDLSLSFFSSLVDTYIISLQNGDHGMVESQHHPHDLRCFPALAQVSMQIGDAYAECSSTERTKAKKKN